MITIENPGALAVIFLVMLSIVIALLIAVLVGISRIRDKQRDQQWRASNFANEMIAYHMRRREDTSLSKAERAHANEMYRTFRALYLKL